MAYNGDEEECSREELVLEFLRNLADIRDYWLSEDRCTAEEKIDGAIFSILVLLDGESCAPGSYWLSASPEEGPDLDIWGDLHNRWYDVLKERRER